MIRKTEVWRGENLALVRGRGKGKRIVRGEREQVWGRGGSKDRTDWNSSI